MLLAAPQFAARKRTDEDSTLHTLGLSLHQIDDGEHTAPRLSEEMKIVEMEMVDESTEFVEPRLRSP